MELPSDVSHKLDRLECGLAEFDPVDGDIVPPQEMHECLEAIHAEAAKRHRFERVLNASRYILDNVAYAFSAASMVGLPPGYSPRNYKNS